MGAPPGPGRSALVSAVAIVALTLGCSEASVDALAVWREQPAAPDGSLRIAIYDGGERRTQRVRITDAGGEGSEVALAVAPGARGFAITTVSATAWIDVLAGTRRRISTDVWGKLELQAEFARSGLALLRRLSNDGGVLLMPTTSPQLEPLLVDVPLPTRVGRELPLRFASDAPVVFAAEIDASGPLGADTTRPDGVIAAWRFATDDGVVPDGTLVPLAHGMLTGGLVIGSAFPRRVGKVWCTDELCIAPGGDAAIAKSPLSSCQLRVFVPGQADVDGRAPTVEVALPPACPSTDPHLVAAIGSDLVVLDDDSFVYLADLGRRSWAAVPKLGATAPRLLPIARGRGMLLVSPDAAVTRVDEDGIRFVNTEHVECAVLDAPLASPGGGWVVQTCLGDAGVIVEMPPDYGSVVRISALGVERFDGIPMRALAVDDEGNALLYSFDPKDDDAAPRGLFVLGSDGRLARVDDLEPAVAPFSSAAGSPHFAARPRD